jgi:hypothetical protein
LTDAQILNRLINRSDDYLRLYKQSDIHGESVKGGGYKYVEASKYMGALT